MFHSFRLRGVRGSIVWGYHTAAILDRWRIGFTRDELTRHVSWTLRARIGGRIDRFQLRQTPLRFAAPREGAFGLWCWPIRTVRVDETTGLLTADLDPPEY